MAFTRKMLAALGVEADKIDEIITAHTEVTSELKGQIDELKAASTYAEKLKTELANTKKELDELKKVDYKAKYEALTAEKEKLKAEYDAYKGEQAAKAARDSKNAAASEYFKSKGNINDDNLKVAMLAADKVIDALEIDDKGKIKDTKALDALADGTLKGLYTVTTTTGTVTPTPPEQGGGSTFEKMSLADKMQFANEKPNDPAVKAWLQG